MPKITQEESLLLQCLATSSLLAALENDNFLQSEYFNQLDFGNEGIKHVLIQSGIGNPATMQMMLYALLVVPKELLPNEAYKHLEHSFQEINPEIRKLLTDFETTYKKEKEINYIRHIRNAISHCRCTYSTEDSKNYVTFTDQNRSECCHIKIECIKVGNILMDLQKLILEYYNQNHA